MKFLNFVDNLKHGISIKYPSSWEKKEEIMDAVVIFLSPTENMEDKFRENLSIMIKDLYMQKCDFYDYLSFSIEQLRDAILEFHLLDKTPTKLSKIPAYRIIYSGKREQIDVKIMQNYAINNNKVYIITYTAEKDKFDEYLKIVLKMIKSFRMIILIN